jgi:hypothetical protein
MALKYADRVAESTVTTGTGDINLAGVIDTDHATFGSQFANGDLMPVSVFGGGKWMTFTGQYNAGPNSISRTTFRRSSTGSNLTLSGTMTVLCGWGADDAAAVLQAAALPAMMRSYLAGLTLSTAGSSSSFGVAAGVATDSANSDVMTQASAVTKTTSAWAVGSGNGSLDTGTIANNTWYHVHLIKRVDTGIVDVLTSTSATAPTLPTNYTLSRRIGSLKTDGSAQWIKFFQVGDEFLWDTPVIEPNINGISVAATVQTIALSRVPPGVRVVGSFLLYASATGGAGIIMSSADQAPSLAFPTGYNLLPSSSQVSSFTRVPTNLSGQINIVATSTATVYANIPGYVDRRGRDS